MKVLAVDYGRKRVGLAISDPLGIIAQPYLTLTVKNQISLIKRLKYTIKENDVQLVLIGQPVSLRGEPTKIADEVGRFARLLSRATGIRVRLWDERFTTRFAQRKFRDLGLKASKKTRDQIAAAIMLEEYLKSEGIAPA